jgi:hypothetical protein
MTKPFYDSTERCSHGILFYPKANRCFECEIVWLETKIKDAEESLEKAKRRLKKVREEQREAKKK